MHKRLGLAAVLMLASMALPARAQDDARPETIEIGLSTDSVAITSNFAGADLTIFGALDNADPLVARQGRYDVIVVLEGPARPVVVRRKNRILGMWINTESLTFVNVPKNDQGQPAPHAVVSVDLGGDGSADTVECGGHGRHGLRRIDTVRYGELEHDT